MNYATIDGLIRTSTNFRGRVTQALYNAAINVLAEVNTTQNHAQRVTFAAKVTSGQADINSAMRAAMSQAVLANNAGPDDTTMLDTDIQTVLNSVFNALAGIGT